MGSLHVHIVVTSCFFINKQKECISIATVDYYRMYKLEESLKSMNRIT